MLKVLQRQMDLSVTQSESTHCGDRLFYGKRYFLSIKFQQINLTQKLHTDIIVHISPLLRFM